MHDFLLSLAVAVLLCFIWRCIRNNSLSDLPQAHPTCGISTWWLERQVKLHGELRTLYAAHSKHGPIVRLAPNEVSVVSEEGLRKVYTAGLDKTAWYLQTFRNYGLPNLVCTLDHATHSRMRKMIAPLYTKSYLHRSDDLDELSRRIVFQRSVPILHNHARKGSDMDVVQFFEWTGVDFISAFIFGSANGTDFLHDEASREEYFGEWRRLREKPNSPAKPVTEDMFLRKCVSALCSPSRASTEGSRPLVIEKMHTALSARAKELDLSEDQVVKSCASEVLDHAIATQETQTVTWTYILYRLSQHPGLQNQLRTELWTLRPRMGSITCDQTLPKPSEIDSLPLLDAIVHETLRLHAANPARMRRKVPPSGLVLHEHLIPPETTISTNAYCLHRNAEVFPDPFDWKPERWLPGAEGLEQSHRWFWAFGSGPRGCIGRHFAVQVLKLVVALIYTHWTTSIVDDEGIEQSDSYNSGPVSHRLILRFHPVEEDGAVI